MISRWNLLVGLIGWSLAALIQTFMLYVRLLVDTSMLYTIESEEWLGLALSVQNFQIAFKIFEVLKNSIIYLTASNECKSTVLNPPS